LTASKNKLHAALSALSPELRKAIAERAAQRLKELDDPESETSKIVRETAESAHRLYTRLRAMSSNGARAHALAQVVKETKNARSASAGDPEASPS
jgi:hypothetical protein